MFTVLTYQMTIASGEIMTSPHVKGEFEVYKNHLSESDFETFKKGFDYKIEIVAERGVYDTI